MHSRSYGFGPTDTRDKKPTKFVQILNVEPSNSNGQWVQWHPEYLKFKSWIRCDYRKCCYINK